jgi:hypothetical protein
VPYAPQIGDAATDVVNARSILAAEQACAAKPVSVPGKYIGMFVSGTVSGATFTSLFGQWSLLQYRKAAAALPSAAKLAPKATPSGSFLYSGTYAMTKSKQKGCVLLIVGQAVKTLASDSPSNGVVFAAPSVTVKNPRVAVVELGLLSMKLTGLSASGGRGTATLITQQLKAYDTATIVLSKRTRIGSR